MEDKSKESISKMGWFLAVLVPIFAFLGSLSGGYLTSEATIRNSEKESRSRVNQAIYKRYVENVIGPLNILYEEMADIHIVSPSRTHPLYPIHYYLDHKKKMPADLVHLDSQKLYKRFINFREIAHNLVFLDEKIKDAFVHQAAKMAFETPFTPGYVYLGEVSDLGELENQMANWEKEGIDTERLENYLMIVDWGARFMQRNLTIITEYIVSTSFASYFDFLNKCKGNCKKKKIQRVLDLMKIYDEQEQAYRRGDVNPLFIFLKFYLKYKDDYFSEEYLEVLDFALDAYKENEETVKIFYGTEFCNWDKRQLCKIISGTSE